jgi:tRNA modification GTPase
LKSCLAHTEAVIDFGDDDRENDINDDAMWALVPRVQVLREIIQKSLSDDKKGEILRDGVQITLLGLPNAGSCSFQLISRYYFLITREIIHS